MTHLADRAVPCCGAVAYQMAGLGGRISVSGAVTIPWYTIRGAGHYPENGRPGAWQSPCEGHDPTGWPQQSGTEYRLGLSSLAAFSAVSFLHEVVLSHHLAGGLSPRQSST